MVSGLKHICYALAAFSMVFVSNLANGTEQSLPETQIIAVKDFSQLAQMAKSQKKLIVLEVSASYCSYCKKLEEAILKPMLRSGDYENIAIIRKIDIDDSGYLRGFEGEPVSAATMARQYKIDITPTLIFLNSENQEVSKRIVGVNSLDYFGSYVDDAIEHGLALIK